MLMKSTIFTLRLNNPVEPFIFSVKLSFLVALNGCVFVLYYRHSFCDGLIYMPMLFDYYVQNLVGFFVMLSLNLA